MKKIAQLCLIGFGSSMLFSSCVFYTVHGVTNNPVGKKTGTVSLGIFQPKGDFSYSSAAKAGKIDKIGTWEIKYGFGKVSTTVSGEPDPNKAKGKGKSKK